MSPSLSRLFRTVAMGFALAALPLTALHVPAQQAPAPAPAAKPDPREAMGGFRPERMKSKELAPHPAKMTITPPEEIPLKNLQVPPGFQVELWAHGMPGARMMTRGDKGTIFIGTRSIGRVYALYERDGKRWVVQGGVHRARSSRGRWW